MAQHIRITAEQEPKVFMLLDQIKAKVFNIGELISTFYKHTISHEGININMMKLSQDYVSEDFFGYSGKNEEYRAYSLGKFTLENTGQDEHESLYTDIDLEVHFHADKDTGKISVEAVYWVV